MTTHELIERLNLHRSWRDSHGELNDAPHKAAQALSTLTDEVAALRQYARCRRDCSMERGGLYCNCGYIATLTKGEGRDDG